MSLFFCNAFKVVIEAARPCSFGVNSTDMPGVRSRRSSDVHSRARQRLMVLPLLAESMGEQHLLCPPSSFLGPPSSHRISPVRISPLRIPPERLDFCQESIGWGDERFA